MKKEIIILFILIAISSPSFAFLRVGVGLPVAGEVDLKSDDGIKSKNVSGYNLGLVVPFGLMLRYDTLIVDTKRNGESFKATASMPGIGYRFDIPLTPFHIAGAFGAGPVKISGGSTKYDTAYTREIYLEGGYTLPIPVVSLDIFLALQNLAGNKFKETASKKELKSSFTGTVYSLGANIGF